VLYFFCAFRFLCFLEQHLLVLETKCQLCLGGAVDTQHIAELSEKEKLFG